METDNGSELTEVTKELVGWEDNKVWRTIKTLTLAPGLAIREYCSGDKARYLSPYTYYFATYGVYYYLLSVSGLEAFYIKDSLPAFTKLFGDAAINNRALEFMSGGIGEKCVMLPGLLLIKWLFFKKYNKSFRQNAWYTLFVDGHLVWLSIPLALFWWSSPTTSLIKPLGYVVSFLAVGYEIWSAKQFYSLKLTTSILLNVVIHILMLLFTFLGVTAVIMFFHLLK